MIKRLYFWDGAIEYHPPITYPECGTIQTINATFGYSNNYELINYIKNQNHPVVVITNNIALLSFDYGWDNEENKSITFLWDNKDSSWKNITEFTDKELKRSHNIEHMYKAGVFNKN